MPQAEERQKKEKELEGILFSWLADSICPKYNVFNRKMTTYLKGTPEFMSTQCPPSN